MYRNQFVDKLSPNTTMVRPTYLSCRLSLFVCCGSSGPSSGGLLSPFGDCLDKLISSAFWHIQVLNISQTWPKCAIPLPLELIYTISAGECFIYTQRYICIYTYVCMLLFGYVLSLSLEWRMRSPFQNFAFIWSVLEQVTFTSRKKKFATGVATLKWAG